MNSLSTEIKLEAHFLWPIHELFTFTAFQLEKSVLAISSKNKTTHDSNFIRN